MVPKPADPATVFGAPNGGVLRALNTSTRNSSDAAPCSRMRRLIARSRLRYAGPLIGLRDALPSVNIGAIAKALVLNQWSGVRWSAGNSGSPTRLGRWTPNPANALKLVVCVTATGTPDCSVRIPDSVQLWIVHTPAATKTCGMSPVE